MCKFLGKKKSKFYFFIHFIWQYHPFVVLLCNNLDLQHIEYDEKSNFYVRVKPGGFARYGTSVIASMGERFSKFESRSH